MKRSILFAIVLAIVLASVPAARASARVSSRCDDLDYGRDLNEIVSIYHADGSPVKQYRPCVDTSSGLYVRTESNASVLVLRSETDAIDADVRSGEMIELTARGVTKRYVLAMVREYDDYQKLPVYAEGGVFIYHTISSGRYQFRWYKQMELDWCEIPNHASIATISARYLVCGGAMWATKTGTTYHIEINSKFVYDDLAANHRMFLDEDSATFNLTHAETLGNMAREQLDAYMISDNSVYFFREILTEEGQGSGRYNVMRYSIDGAAFQLFIVTARRHSK